MDAHTGTVHTELRYIKQGTSLPTILSAHLVCSILVALAKPFAARQRSSLSHAYQLQGQVTLHSAVVRACRAAQQMMGTGGSMDCQTALYSTRNN